MALFPFWSPLQKAWKHRAARHAYAHDPDLDLEVLEAYDV